MAARRTDQRRGAVLVRRHWPSNCALAVSNSASVSAFEACSAASSFRSAIGSRGAAAGTGGAPGGVELLLQLPVVGGLLRLVARQRVRHPGLAWPIQEEHLRTAVLRAEDLRLLSGELLLGQDPLVPQRGELPQLLDRVERGRSRRRLGVLLRRGS